MGEQAREPFHGEARQVSDEGVDAVLAREMRRVADGDQRRADVRDMAAELACYYTTLKELGVPAALAARLTEAWQASAWLDDNGGLF